MISLKETGEAFVFTGDTKGARRVRKYSPGAVLESEESLDTGLFEWIIYDDFVVYFGPFLPISKSPYYVGKVATTFAFEKTITDEWEHGAIPMLFNWYEQNREREKMRRKG